MNGSQQQPTTGGHIFLQAVPSALCPHVRWALENVMRTPVRLAWTDQKAQPGSQRAEIEWAGAPGTAAQLASALRQLKNLYFEITERATSQGSAQRFMHTPSLGICVLPTDAQGNFTVTEDRIRYAFERAQGDYGELYRQFSLALGQEWDQELEPLRVGSGHSNIQRISRRSTAY